MGLAGARPLAGELPPLPSGPPYACAELSAWAGVAFELSPHAPRLSAIHRGAAVDSAPLDNLVGAVRAWQDHPEWLDFLDPEAPNHADKLLERGIYLDRWEPHLAGARHVLDVGGGIGRFTLWCLERGLAVDLVDPDLRSLWRAVNRAAGGPGKLDVHWSTGEQMPRLGPVDAAIACEVLCYVEDPARVLDNIAQALRPGGVLLASVEARQGWVSAPDVAPDTLEAWLTDGVVHVPGDRWIRTYEAEDFRSLLEERFEIREMLATHYVSSGPFEMAAGPLPLRRALALEEQLRGHPLAGPWNRAWTAVAVKR